MIDTLSLLDFAPIPWEEKEEDAITVHFLYIIVFQGGNVGTNTYRTVCLSQGYWCFMGHKGRN